MSAIEAVISEPLRVHLCGAIRPVRTNNCWQARSVRFFVASGLVVFGGRIAWLSTRENQLLSAIVADQTRTQRQSMIAAVGESDADGGPDYIEGVVGLICRRLKAKLNAIGLDLVRNGHPHAPFAIRRREH